MVAVPKHVQDHYQEIILAIDIMHVNQIPFLITASRHIHYHTASVLPSMNGGIIVSALCVLYKFYQKCNFQITEVLADCQFAVCQHNLAALQMNLNYMSKDQHIPEVERLTQTIKEQCRCSFHTTLFKKLLRGLTIGLLKNVMFYLNAFPDKDGVLKD